MCRLLPTRMGSRKEDSMHVQELMTTPVLSIGPEASLKDVAVLFLERGISGLPVCDAENRVLGVISEGDILLKESGPDSRNGPRLARLAGRSGRGGAKSIATTVREAMTTPAITISPRSNITEAARLMTEHAVNRLPVVKGVELVGIVTRTDLVRAFTRSDEEIERELREEVLLRTLWVDPDTVRVEVTRGAVKLDGMLETRVDVDLLERLTARVPGVVSVASSLTSKVEESGWRERLLRDRGRP